MGTCRSGDALRPEALVPDATARRASRHLWPHWRLGYLLRARRSASSSQSLTCFMTSWRGGMPLGKRVRKSASRSILAELPLPAAAAAVRRPRRGAVLLVFVRVRVPRLRLVALAEVPATPWVILRCA